MMILVIIFDHVGAIRDREHELLMCIDYNAAAVGYWLLVTK